MDVETRNAIVTTLLGLRKLLSQSRSELAGLSEVELVHLHEQLDAEVDRLGGLVPGATPPSRIEDFFSQVGEGMAAAQAELDRQSFAYNLARREGVLPSTYRIPKVQAEIGFAMSRKRSKQFGVFALGRSESGEKRHSNTASFEVISVPPLSDSLDQIPIGARFVSSQVERLQIEEQLKSAKSENTASLSTAAALLEDFDRVLIFTHGDQQLLARVILVDDGVPATTEFGVLIRGEPARFTSYGPVPASQAEQGRWVLLRDFLGSIADAQERLLSPAK